jgi:hypothetical protein
MVSPSCLKFVLICVLVAVHTSDSNARRDKTKERGLKKNKWSNYIFERKEMHLAEGFLYLNSSYNKKVPPDGTKVTVWMDPGFIFEIDSQARQVEMEMKIRLMWEDNRVVWPHWENISCGQKLSFDVSILK